MSHEYVYYGTEETEFGGRELTGETYCADCSEETDEAVHMPEVDAPIHCSDCETLLPVELTDAGREYVAESLIYDTLEDKGRAAILEQWAAEFPTAVERAVEQLRADGPAYAVRQLLERAIEYRAR